MASCEVHNRTFKLALLGDAAVGKTSYKVRHFTGEEPKDHQTTNACEISHPLMFTLGRGRGSVQFEIWDIAGNQGPMNRCSEYIKGSNAAIIMFDVSRWKTWESVAGWYQELLSATHKDIPVVVCANKVDDQCERQVRLEDMSWADEMSGVKYYETSVKANLNLEEPFLWLTKTLLNDQTLEWGSSLLCSGLVGPSVDPDLMKRYQREMEKASKLPLPDEDDADLWSVCNATMKRRQGMQLSDES